MILVGVGAGAAAESELSDRGQILFFARARPSAKRRPAITEHHQTTLLDHAGALAAELVDQRIDAVTRIETLLKLGELISNAWALAPPGDQLPAALLRIVVEAASEDPTTRVAAESALRLIVDVLSDHARGPAFHSRLGFENISRAIDVIARIKHPVAFSALYAIYRDAREPDARSLAAFKLGELASRRQPDQYAELCTRLLLK